jgi:hypothetical protein
MPAKRSDVDIICQVNDHPILQDHQDRTSQRKPDVLILPCKRALATLRKGYRDMTADEFRLTSAAAKPESRLFWEDVLACIEFKRPTKKLPKPPPSYEVKGISVRGTFGARSTRDCSGKLWADPSTTTYIRT